MGDTQTFDMFALVRCGFVAPYSWNLKVGELEIDLFELSGASVFFSFRQLVAYILGISKRGRGLESFMPMLTYQWPKHGLLSYRRSWPYTHRDIAIVRNPDCRGVMTITVSAMNHSHVTWPLAALAHLSGVRSWNFNAWLRNWKMNMKTSARRRWDRWDRWNAVAPSGESLWKMGWCEPFGSATAWRARFPMKISIFMLGMACDKLSCAYHVWFQQVKKRSGISWNRFEEVYGPHLLFRSL